MRCDECGIRFDSAAALRMHKLRKHGKLRGNPRRLQKTPVATPVAGEHTCTTCFKQYGSTGSLRSHERMVHGIFKRGKRAVQKDVKQFNVNFCPSCGFHLASIAGAGE